ncbi:MAG TPA: sulfatase [Thermoanaerobaculia bacterium]|nr:sulfatase [Thermoanaerobaculia bacterium]
MPGSRAEAEGARPGTRRLRTFAAAVLLAGGLSGLSSCRRPAGDTFVLPEPGPARGLAAWEAAGFELPGEVELGEAASGGERRPVLRTSFSGLSWTGWLSQEARLHLGVAIDGDEVDRAGKVALVVERREDDGQRRELLREPLAAGADGGWRDLSLDLSGDRAGRVTLAARLEADTAALAEARRVAWGPVALRAGRAERRGGPRPARPDVVLVVIDTLRADHVGAYGYARDTTPRLDALFAARGTLFERAYAQAPWTLPSAASYLTGRHPGELQRSRAAGVVIPDDVPTLAERLRAGGYRTAAFVANPTLFPAAGFDRGFDTWWLPPARVESLARPAGDVVERAAPWLEAHAGAEEPFFLYLHFIDPHDPYSSPDTSGERSPFLPDYGGRLTGHDVHALYLGHQALAEGEAEAAADRAQITALYDSEIAWVDRALGELVDQLPPEVVRETLWIVTSDHGEELHERGGWKHGHTLYDEQVRVPLLVRWGWRGRGGAARWGRGAAARPGADRTSGRRCGSAGRAARSRPAARAARRRAALTTGAGAAAELRAGARRRGVGRLEAGSLQRARAVRARRRAPARHLRARPPAPRAGGAARSRARSRGGPQPRSGAARQTRRAGAAGARSARPRAAGAAGERRRRPRGPRAARRAHARRRARRLVAGAARCRRPRRATRRAPASRVARLAARQGSAAARPKRRDLERRGVARRGADRTPEGGGG